MYPICLYLGKCSLYRSNVLLNCDVVYVVIILIASINKFVYEEHVFTAEYEWRSEDNLKQWILLTHDIHHRNQTQGHKLDGKCQFNEVF